MVVTHEREVEWVNDAIRESKPPRQRFIRKDSNLIRRNSIKILTRIFLVKFLKGHFVTLLVNFSVKVRSSL